MFTEPIRTRAFTGPAPQLLVRLQLPRPDPLRLRLARRVHHLKQSIRMRFARGLIQLQRGPNLSSRGLGCRCHWNDRAQRQVERVGIIDSERAARGMRASVCVSRITNQHCAIAEDPRRQRLGAREVWVESDVGRDVRQGFDNGVPVLVFSLRI